MNRGELRIKDWPQRFNSSEKPCTIRRLGWLSFSARTSSSPLSRRRTNCVMKARTCTRESLWMSSGKSALFAKRIGDYRHRSTTLSASYRRIPRRRESRESCFRKSRRLRISSTARSFRTSTKSTKTKRWCWLSRRSAEFVGSKFRKRPRTTG